MRRTALIAFATAFLTAFPVAAVDRLDARDFETGVAACQDLYRFANGGWLKSTPVPFGQDRINRFTLLEQHVQGQQRELLQRLLADSSASSSDPLRNLLLSAQNAAAVSSASDVALAALLPAVDQLTRPEQLPELITLYQQRGLSLLFDANAARNGGVELRSALLTLPDPAFYLDPDPAARAWLGRYRGYVEAILALTGSRDVSGDSAWVIDFETRIATAVQNSPRVPVALSARELAKRHPALQWKPMLKALGLNKIGRFVLSDAAALDASAELLRSAHPVQWQAWLRFRIGHLLAPYLGPGFSEPHQRFIHTALLGEPAEVDTQNRLLRLARAELGDVFAARYAEAYLPAARRAAFEHVLGAVREALAAAVNSNTRWEKATAKLAMSKLKSLQVQVVALDAPDVSKLQLSPSNLAGNVLAIRRWRLDRIANGRAQPPLSIDPLQPQLGYQPDHNRLLLSPAVLQPPLFDQGAESALQFAGLGALIAHELSHAVDLIGANFDAEGAAKPWWSEADRAAWLSASQPLVAQYSAYTAVGEHRVDGERSRGENAADLSGLNLAWQAWLSTQPDPKLPVSDGLTPAQRFFVAWASLWRENASEAARLRDLQHTEHAPPAQRVIGPLQHLPAFAEAFGCKTPPADATTVDPWP